MVKEELDGLDITNQVLLFRDFLNNSWDDLDELMYDHDWEDDGGFTDDWVQVNWESLVEKKVTKNKSLISSLNMPCPDDRMTKPDQKYQYLVLVEPKKDEIIVDLCKGKEIDFSSDVRLFSFSKSLKPGFKPCFPFDVCYVCIDKTKKWYVVPFKKLKIYLKKVS